MEASRFLGRAPHAGAPDFLVEGLREAEAGLRRVAADVASGRTYLALYDLALHQDMVASTVFWVENQEAANGAERFDELWETMGPELEEEVRSLANAFEGQSAAVRARGELVMNRILSQHRAARLYAKAGESAGGLFYLGSAQAAARLARFVSTLEDEPSARSPRLERLTAVESRLSRLALEAYGRGDAATVHHQSFIRLDAALKEARELIADGRRYGAASSLLEARLRLGLVTTPSGAAPGLEQASYRARLFDPNRDHSLARELWERALKGARSSDEHERRLAAIITDEVIPFYFANLTD